MGKNVTIVGAGLVGSLWAVYLSRAGYKVTIFERRSDIRKADISAGKSINLALSVRGWKALDAVGVGDEVRKIAIPMYGRIMHDMKGQLSYQPYGKEGQAIYSVSRGKINATMMDIAEREGNAEICYNHECVAVDFEKSVSFIKNTLSGEEIQVQVSSKAPVDINTKNNLSPALRLSRPENCFPCMSYLVLFFRFCRRGAIAFTVLRVLLLTSPSCFLLFLINQDEPISLSDTENKVNTRIEYNEEEEHDLP